MRNAFIPRSLGRKRRRRERRGEDRSQGAGTASASRREHPRYADSLAKRPQPGLRSISSSWGWISGSITSSRLVKRRTSLQSNRTPPRRRIVEASKASARGHSCVRSNDCNLSSDADQICLITGPNMAGKSTFIRQVALITLMVKSVGRSAKSCRMGLVDRIFSRSGR